MTTASRLSSLSSILLRSLALPALLISLLYLSASAQQISPPASTPLPAPRLVGYLRAVKGTSLADSIRSLELSKITDIDLAFGDPPKCNGICTASSNMQFSLQGRSDADIDKAVAEAHAAGVKVLVSIGGGGGDQQIIQFYNVGLTAPLVASLNRFVLAHHLDGVDLDIEDPSNMGNPYATFTNALISTFHPEGKLVTAAVAKYLQASMPGTALRQFDYLNVMNYSSYANALIALNFYAKEEHIARSKLVLGVPFFGSNDDDSKEESYKNILGSYPNAWKVDLVGGGPLDNGQAFHYVGEQTMAQETQLGRQYGGIMIWELEGDARSPHSLLEVIERTLAISTSSQEHCPCSTLAQKQINATED